MKTKEVISLVEMYERCFQIEHIPKVRMDPRRTFQSLSKEEILAHAHFLCDGVKEYARDPKRRRKTGSHLTAVQMCLSFAGWFTLDDLLNHNRSVPKGDY